MAGVSIARGSASHGSLRQTIGGLVALAAAAAVVLAMNEMSPAYAVMLLFGLAFGVTLQRARFCFASSFRDLFLLQDGRVMKGILLGMAVATVGFAFVMYNFVPNLAFGRYPPSAAVSPLGLHTILAGAIFGVGMVLAGGCVSGSCYRVGEGYVASAVAIVGIMGGLTLLGWTWPWWWNNYISYLPRIWLPHWLGWGGSVVITLAGLLLAYLVVLWWESRGGIVVRPRSAPPSGETFGARLSALRQTMLVNPWPVAAAGVALGALNAAEYLFERPWGVVGEISRWADALAGLVGLSYRNLMTAGVDVGACALPASQGFLSTGLMINGGMIFGAFVAALLAGEFRVRFPRQRGRYFQSLGGGVLMGYGAGLVAGCTIGAFFSAIPSLSLNGWVFGIGLALGAFVGVKIIQRIG